MKKLFALFIFAIATIVGTQAQTPTPAPSQAKPQSKAVGKPRVSIEERVKERVDKLNSICSLTPDQTSKVTALMTEVINKRQAARKAGVKDSPELKESLKEIDKYKNSKLKEILTADQIAKLKAYHKSLKAKPSEAEGDTKIE